MRPRSIGLALGVVLGVALIAGTAITASAIAAKADPTAADPSTAVRAADPAASVTADRAADRPSAAIRTAADPAMIADYRAAIDQRLAVVAAATATLADKLDQRRGEIQRRLRTYYAASRSAAQRRWLDPDERARDLRRTGAVRRILRRDLTELALIEREAELAAAARDRLLAARDRPPSTPIPGSLRRPVDGAPIVGNFGRYRDPATRTYLSRRGVELGATPGREVRAAAAGAVVFAGSLRGVGDVIVIDHGDFTTVVSRLGELAVAAGDEVSRGQVIARAASERVAFEVRAGGMDRGFAVDPAPLLAP